MEIMDKKLQEETLKVLKSIEEYCPNELIGAENKCYYPCDCVKCWVNALEESLNK